MCNACGFQCCAYDGFAKCGCDHCHEPACWDLCDVCGENGCDGGCQAEADYDYDSDGTDDIDVDVCQNCGAYFVWTPELAAAWREHWKPGPNSIQPQRCRACIVDECHVEDRA